MNKDTVEGAVKDVAGRIQRQAGEWTNDPKQQAAGAVKQVEGKVQNAYGKAKDAVQDAADKAHAPAKPPRRSEETTDRDETAEDVGS